MTEGKPPTWVKKLLFVVLFVLCFAVVLTLVFQGVKAQVDQSNSGSQIDLQDLKAKAGEDVEYSVDRTTEKANFIAKGDGTLPVSLGEVKDPEGVANQFMKEYGSYFGLSDPSRELSVSQEQEDELGMKHVRYDQQYQGVPVYGGQLIVHLNKDLAIKSANGRVVPDVSLDVNPKISKEEAISKAKTLWKEQFNLDEAEVLGADLYVFNKTLIENKLDPNFYLVWQVELYNSESVTHELFFIDARSGKLVYQLTKIRNAIYREIWDGSLIPWLGGWGLDYTFWGYTYGRSEGKPARGANPWWFSTDVDDLYSLVNISHNYWHSKFGLNGANNKGGLGDGTNSPFATTRVKAYLDDSGFACPNAYSNNFELGFCSGTVLLDVVAHEYGHSVLSFAVPSIPYKSESGAVHEAYADIAGEAVENYGTGSSDWIDGTSASARNMADPTSSSDSISPYPDRFYSSYFYCGTQDNSGVHHNSTVPSHAAYLMAMGGTHNGCSVSAIGRDKQERIFYQAEKYYITSSVDFNSLYNNLNSGCSSLYGSGSAECTTTRKALQSVELNQGGACSGEPRTEPVCAETTVPYFSAKGPANGSTGVATNTDIYFEIDDAGAGVNKNSLRAKINGTTAVSGGAFQSGYSGSISADGNGYHVTVNPNSDFSANESVNVYASGSDFNGASANTSWSFTIAPPKSPKIIATSGPGEVTRMQAYDDHGNAAGSEIHDLFPSSYFGGAGIVSIDANNDGLKDEVAVYARADGGPQVRVLSVNSNSTLGLLGQMFVFDDSNRSGLSVTAGDFDADGFRDDIATCLTGDDQPEVRVYKDARGIDNWEQIGQIVAPFGNVGCNLGTFQYDDGAEEILIGPNHGPANPNVYIYTVGGTQKKAFAAYGIGVQGGVSPSGIGERIYTTPNNGSSQVNAYDRDGNWKNFWWAYAEHVRGDWLNVAGDVDGDGVDEILTAPFGANGPQILAFEPSGKWRTWPNFFAFSENLRNGVGIAVIENWSD